MTDGRDREALRQQMLLRALWRDARPGVVAGWLRDPPERFARGLRAYQANGGALAERALAAAYPTLAELIGPDSFAALARHFWLTEPPRRGDIGEWGGGLPGFVARSETLSTEPYLADVACLDWAVHLAASAADHQGGVTGLDLLGSTDPAALRVHLGPGTAVLVSDHPVVSIWQAHRSDAPGRFDAAREAMAAGRGEAARVWRDGFAVRVEATSRDEARFTNALLQGATLGQALDAAPAIDFEAWLHAALRERWLVAVALETPGDALVA